MYGLVNKAVEQMVCTHYGQETWMAIRQHAGLDEASFLSMHQYPDSVTYRLVDSAHTQLGASHAEILRSFGKYWTLYTAAEGYGDLFKLTGATLKEFLHHLNNLHARVGLSYPALCPPAFECDDISESVLLLHYYSDRVGLTAMVIGLIEGLSEMYQTPVTIELIQSRDQGADHDIFELHFL